LVRTLRGLSANFGSLDHDNYRELDVERDLASNAMLSLAEFCYWTRKMQARYFAGDPASAVDASLEAHRLLWSAPSQIVTADFRFFSALAHAAVCNISSPDQKAWHLEKLVSHQKQLEIWEEHCPANFEDRATLVRAEMARIEGRIVDAEELYEQAIRLARSNRFIHNEALSNELAGRFYMARGFQKIGAIYMRDACTHYESWGADAKATQLEQICPRINFDRSGQEVTSTIHRSVAQLDLATVIKVSETVSGEIVLEKLIDTLIRMAIEHAGAERGLLVLKQGDDYKIRAEATTGPGKIQVAFCQSEVTSDDLPESVFQYVIRTKESVVLHDASGPSPYTDDEYIRLHCSRSILCLPILKQSRLLGVLYLENKLSSYAFTPSRTAILKLLASESASSIENGRLYRDLADREARFRSLVDANIIGIVITDNDGRIHEANDAFLQMVGYEREDIVSQGVYWTDMTPPEWRERDEKELIPELRTTGSLRPFEKEFFRKDGSRVPVLIGVANFDEGSDMGVAFVLDLTERHASAVALQGLQMDLAHASRLATMGQLTASIAHEINQPIGAARNNAHAALRFLAADPPNFVEANDAIECVVKDTYRAGAIIQGIRDQIIKAPRVKEDFSLNDAIQEVIALVHGELSRVDASLVTRLTQDLPFANGDRVQVQQVIVNLTLNAIEAMGKSDYTRRVVTISTETQTPGEILVCVSDSGPGIHSEDRERIFESFYTTKDSGVGIGLSICRSIISAHGGELWVEENTPRGAAIKFTLLAQVTPSISDNALNGGPA